MSANPLTYNTHDVSKAGLLFIKFLIFSPGVKCGSSLKIFLRPSTNIN